MKTKRAKLKVAISLLTEAKYMITETDYVSPYYVQSYIAKVIKILTKEVAHEG